MARICCHGFRLSVRIRAAVVCAASVFAFAIACVAAAEAATRVCKPLVVGDIKRAPSEMDAKRAALADWVAKANAAGALHPAWRIAFNKRLRCGRVGSQFECVALGQPCTIVQKAPRKGPDPRGPAVET